MLNFPDNLGPVKIVGDGTSVENLTASGWCLVGICECSEVVTTSRQVPDPNASYAGAMMYLTESATIQGLRYVLAMSKDDQVQQLIAENQNLRDSLLKAAERAAAESTSVKEAETRAKELTELKAKLVGLEQQLADLKKLHAEVDGLRKVDSERLYLLWRHLGVGQMQSILGEVDPPEGLPKSTYERVAADDDF